MSCKWRILSVGPEATLDDARKAFRKKARLMHPDKDRTEGASERFQQLEAEMRAFENAYLEPAVKRVRVVDTRTVDEINAEWARKMDAYFNSPQGKADQARWKAEEEEKKIWREAEKWRPWTREEYDLRARIYAFVYGRTGLFPYVDRRGEEYVNNFGPVGPFRLNLSHNLAPSERSCPFRLNLSHIFWPDWLFGSLSGRVLGTKKKKKSVR